MLALVNAQRAAAGCGALTADPALATSPGRTVPTCGTATSSPTSTPTASTRSTAPGRAGLDGRAENIAHGQPEPAAVMDAWMYSAGHRANILDCSLTRLGVGMAEGAGGPWWTQLFA